VNTFDCCCVLAGAMSGMKIPKNMKGGKMPNMHMDVNQMSRMIPPHMLQMMGGAFGSASVHLLGIVDRPVVHPSLGSVLNAPFRSVRNTPTFVSESRVCALMLPRSWSLMTEFDTSAMSNTAADCGCAGPAALQNLMKSMEGKM